MTEFEPDRRLSIQGALGSFRGETTYLLTPAEKGTVLTNTILRSRHTYQLGASTAMARALFDVNGQREVLLDQLYSWTPEA